MQVKTVDLMDPEYTIVKKHVQAEFLQNSFQGILIDTPEQTFDLFSGHKDWIP